MNDFIYEKRIASLREEIKLRKLDAIIVSDRINIRYLTGFEGKFGFLILSKNNAVFLTDSRYYERSRKEIKSASTKLIKKNWMDSLKFKKIAFEACSVDFNTYKNWKKGIKNAELIPVRNAVEKLRMIKDNVEIGRIIKAATITENVMKKALRSLKIGITEEYLGKKIINWFAGYDDTVYSFIPIAAFGKNTAMPHANLTKRKLCNNDLIMIDLGALYKGYSSDLTRTFCKGRITERFRKIYNIVLEAQERAIQTVKPGKKCSEVDSAARKYIHKQGFGRYFTHCVGHGVGSIVHEIPRVGPDNKNFLVPGMVFTVEPGIYVPGWGGVRIEDLVLVTKTGCRILTKHPKGINDIVM